ncbi:MAG: hypothetical protein AB7N76_21360 [Planctomycetota bacterium]
MSKRRSRDPRGRESTTGRTRPEDDPRARPSGGGRPDKHARERRVAALDDSGDGGFALVEDDEDDSDTGAEPLPRAEPRRSSEGRSGGGRVSSGGRVSATGKARREGDDEDRRERRRSDDDEGRRERKRTREKRRGAAYLPEPGQPPSKDPAARDVRRVVGQLRGKCGACGFRRLCAFAPVKLHIDRRRDKRLPHRHQAVLRAGLKELSKIEGDWESALVSMLAGPEKDALLAGCLIYELWRKRPEKVRRLTDYTADRCGVDELKAAIGDDASREEEAGLRPGQGIDPDRLLTRAFRSQVLRAISFFQQDEVLGGLQDLLVLDADDEGRLVQAEAVAVLSFLIGRKMSPEKWVGSLEKDAQGPFRATFAYRAPGHGGLDLFFPYRRGKRRSYLYYRRDPEGGARLSSVDKVRIDSLLHRIFLVFEGDALKTHRVFKELCRHINVRAGHYNANHVLAGFERLDRDDLLLLGVYAPALARAVGHFLGIEGYHLLIKLLYELRSESGRRGEPRVPAHEKVVLARERWEEVVREVGPDTIKAVFSVLFRLNASYKKRIYTTPTYLKIGEVAYLLTALAGWNPKGLEIELKQGRKALAFVAYGLQPPGRWSRIRVGKLRRAYERILDRSDGREEIWRACEQGMRYAAAVHGYESFEELEAVAASADWEPPAPESTRLPANIQADQEDFSEYADEDSLEEEEEEDVESSEDLSEDDDVMVVIEDDDMDEAGRLRSQRSPRQR